MLKLKSKSISLGQPAAQELKEHVDKLIQKQQECMRQKLSRQYDKEARVQALERQFVDWADRKENNIKLKMDKSIKNKEDHLSKIVKKCKDHDKYLGQKYKNFKSKKKTELKEAWKKAEAFNTSIEEYQHSKQISHQRPSHKERTEEDMTQSRFVGKRPTSYEKGRPKQYIVAGYNNPSKYTSKYYENGSGAYWNQLNQSMRYLKMSQPLPKMQDQKSHTPKSPTNQMNAKLKETLERFKTYNQTSEHTKIQQLGQRLQKIQKTRHKRIELNKKKKHQRQMPQDIDYMQRRQPKRKIDRSERLHSQTMIREKRVHDWSESTKQRRQQYLQSHLQAGTQYLEQQKVKYLKTHLAKKIAGSAIEKKLYYERLHH